MSTNSNFQVIETDNTPIKIWTNDIEESARQQLINVSKLPFIHKHVAVMPDVHAGIGATIGSVIATKGAIIPAAVGVDIGCFTGDTKVELADGRKLTFLEIIDELASGKELYCYSVDKNGSVKIAKIDRCMETRKTKSLTKVLLDNWEEIFSTPDHIYFKSNMEEIEAKDMKNGESLQPLYIGKAQTETPVELLDTKYISNDYKVLSVELIELDEEIPVYCLTSSEYSNFALAAGVFVHNCGMLAVKTSLTSNDIDDASLKKVYDQICRDVPVGRGEHNDRGFVSYAKTFESELRSITNKHPGIVDTRNEYRWTKQLGTLGSGNHFIEICLDESNDVWVMLHSGSRGIGNSIGKYFIELARQDMQKWFINLPDKDLAYIPEGTDHFDDYIEALSWAQTYAWNNRQCMLDLVVKAMARYLPTFRIIDEVVNCHHNYVSHENHFNTNVYVTRKGAIRAREGEYGIIPGSMGAKSFIVRGKGNKESFCSCSHGAGRKMSRTAASKQFTEVDLQNQTDGVMCRKDSGVIDEIPSAYKDIDEVMNNQLDLVEVVHTLKQIACIKG